MDIQADLKWIHRELDNVEDPTLIMALKNMLKYSKKLTSERISVEQYNKELDESIMDIETGNCKNHEDVKSMIQEWGRK